ncbi:hypothetical protein [Oceanirhabdus sp. W0125-5]|uniref:hypothetical protein n=1 Tax=Oceanirhabdus sp. W0125-5 TaxID=2999116 RepID=UPI0022F327B7|nr:hypothetical protein [Oceanirhabdus sp. W0125-5]WBW97233.1 hypothetical protein OW730_26625 [Oceanirhabdus sp. W0125-5]
MMNVKLGEYKGFDFKRPEVIVKDYEINDYCLKIRERYKIDVDKKGIVEKGDYIAIDYDGYYEGEHVSKLSAKNYHSKIGEGFLMKEFEDSIVGKSKNDIIEIDVIMPKDTSIRYLRGEEVHFKIRILSVMERIIPELTDDVVRSFKIEGINTIDELKAYAKDNIYYQKMMAESAKTINEIMRKIIETSEVQLTDEEVESLKNEILEDFKKQLEEKNTNLQIYLSYTKKTEEELIEQCKLEAETYLTEKAIIEKIAQEENISFSKEEKERYSNFDEEELNQKLYQKVVLFLLKENTNL